MKIELKEVVINTISMCTQRCWHCRFGVDPPPVKILSQEHVFKIVDDLAAINYNRRLSFFCGNEPLLDPRQEDFFKYATKKLTGATLTLFSNGDLATSNVLKRLFDSGMQKITFSLHHLAREFDIRKLQHEFGAERVLVYDHTKPAFFTSCHNHGGLIKSKLVSQRKYPESSCALPFKQLVVHPDFAIGQCCVDMSENVKVKLNTSQSVVDVFYECSELNNLRKMLASNKRDKAPCSECSYNGLDYFG